MTTTWPISIRPPFADDCWAIVRARFLDAQYWEADSKQAAIDQLKAGIDDPRNVPGENPPVTRQTVAIDAHEDFANSITLDTLFENQVGLASFGEATTEEPWFKAQPEWTQLEPLYDADRVLHATSGDGPAEHPSGWEWDYAIWARHAGDKEFDIVLHRPERYEWTTKTAETSELIRILQGRWHTQGSAHLKQFYFEKSHEDTDDPYLAWEPAAVEYHPESESPFDPSWDFCPGAPMAINGWEYDPHARLSREVWRSTTTPERRVELHHNPSDYSFLKVFDSRVSGADAAMVPDGFDGKVQSTTSASDLRDKAVRWMRQHSPGGVAHPAFDAQLLETPAGWVLDRSPGVRYGTEFHVRYRKETPSDEETNVFIEIAGPSKSTDFRVTRIEQVGETGRKTTESIPTPEHCSPVVAHSRFRKFVRSNTESPADGPTRAHP
ncbi:MULTISPECIES: hypothetical protein [Haloferacaceae]|uniref:Uncharacterized protein n=2 Tax=Haloferacaceae TaxID=1644056 RepID=A0ABD6DF81_9EURY|nr:MULTISPECIES: hypothetical protein [Halorubraceae]